MERVKAISRIYGADRIVRRKRMTTLRRGQEFARLLAAWVAVAPRLFPCAGPGPARRARTVPARIDFRPRLHPIWVTRRFGRRQRRQNTRACPPRPSRAASRDAVGALQFAGESFDSILCPARDPTESSARDGVDRDALSRPPGSEKASPRSCTLPVWTRWPRSLIAGTHLISVGCNEESLLLGDRRELGGVGVGRTRKLGLSSVSAVPLVVREGDVPR